MPVDGSTTTRKHETVACEELEMHTISHNEDHSAPDAPLIPRAPYQSSDGPSADAGPESRIDESGSLGGWFIWILTFSAGISGLLFGYELRSRSRTSVFTWLTLSAVLSTGVISSTLVSIGSDLSQHPLTTSDKSLIASCTSLFALFASPTTGVLADQLGRKRIILIADGLFVVGALWQALTSSVWGMIVGRSIIGAAVGGASLVVPL